MISKSAFFLVVLLSASVRATLIYDGFDYPTPAPPSALGGNSNSFDPSLPRVWTAGQVSATKPDVQVTAAGLSFAAAYPSADPASLPTSTGNAVTLSSASSAVDRLGLGKAFSTGTLYYSLLVKVSDLTGAATAGAFVAGFNNSDGSATSAVSQAGARLQFRKSTGATYNLGIRADVVGANSSNIAWDSTDRSVGDTVFVVASYTFVNPGTAGTDDQVQLWINPDPSTFGATDAPTTTLVSTVGDISQAQIQSFFFRQNGSAPASVVADELRVSTSWAGVTGTTALETVPEPSGLVLATLAAGLLLRRRRHLITD